jgi:nucleoside phosphorylase
MINSKYTIGIVSPAFALFDYGGNILKNEEIIGNDGHVYRTGFVNGLRIIILGCDMDAAAISLATLPLPLLDQVTHLIYMGYAGAVKEKLKVGDMVLATQMITENSPRNQKVNDKDLNGKNREIFMDSKVSKLLYQAAEQVIIDSGIDPLISAKQELQFRLNAAPVIFRGPAGVGDPFYISPAKRERALKLTPELICLEKEGLSVALISRRHAIPLGIIHMIVQGGDETEQIDYAAFITNVANRYIAEITFAFIHRFSELTLLNK